MSALIFDVDEHGVIRDTRTGEEAFAPEVVDLLTDLQKALTELVRVQTDGDWEYWRGARDRAEAVLAVAAGKVIKQ